MNVRDRLSLFQEIYSQHKVPFAIVFLIWAALTTGDWMLQFISRWIVIPKAGSIEFLGVPLPLWGLILLAAVISPGTIHD